ncbi:ATP-binding protein [Patescibacteria group bacterium]|nr:ATP-binding protein [Patescibacteria group bacterium]MBU3999795.1 ATP-binding protein [Patescibacteria group bacterium]MBU4056649.1 ATP-binding protein [Patescibacteria group bacterium]MBU4368742.1 ATP-binding protein [Patescibacteria group bacterium]
MSIIRDITIKAQKYLKDDDILLFIGPRQAGKTTILRQLENILKKNNAVVYFLNLEDVEYLELLNKTPKNIFKIFPMDLSKRSFVFIDEVQYLANPSNFLKYLYDEYRGKIKLLVSGSSAFYIDKKFKDSLAGRKKIFDVPTLSFRDFLRFKGEADLSQKNFEKLSLSEKEKIEMHYRQYLVYGGYPRVVLAANEEKTEILREIAYSYIKKDIYEANIRQDEVFYKLFKILASQIGNLTNASELALTFGVSKTAIDNFLYVMQKSFHIELIRPFFKNKRKELTKMPKVYFSDLGLRNFFADNFKPFEIRDDRGALLENAAMRQLTEKYGKQKIKFWRTIGKHEIDFIADEKEAFEVKIDPSKIKANNYKKFLGSYPNINLSIISLNTQAGAVGKYKILEAWQI